MVLPKTLRIPWPAFTLSIRNKKSGLDNTKIDGLAHFGLSHMRSQRKEKHVVSIGCSRVPGHYPYEVLSDLR